MLLTTAIVLLTSTALASGVRLHNKDARAYKLYVKHAGSAVHTSIGARTVTNICSATCTIKLKDTSAKITAGPGDKVVIQAGRLIKR
ncbi:MAG: hypothetical protein ACI9WU_000417 [Myxococcota bacterium]|jgi:hypothetical protein